MSESLKNIKGTQDILFDDNNIWQYLESNIHQFLNKYGFSQIRTPIFENTNLFSRSIGTQTDIVSKEMYSWTDQGGNNLTLKPEVTASVVRAYIQHNLGKKNPINKLYYIDTLFRRVTPKILDKVRRRRIVPYSLSSSGVPISFFFSRAVLTNFTNKDISSKEVFSPCAPIGGIT